MVWKIGEKQVEIRFPSKKGDGVYNSRDFRNASWKTKGLAREHPGKETTDPAAPRMDSEQVLHDEVHPEC